MTQEEKELLIKDLCGRLPYGVKCADFKYDNNGNKIDTVEVLGIINPDYQNYSYLGDIATHEINRIKPYLRDMSSMTEDEKEERNNIALFHSGNIASIPTYIDWLNAHHFDYRGLIEKGLALEAPEEMYKTE